MSLLPSPFWGLPQSHLPTVPNHDEGASGVEGPGATGQQVGSVVRLQHPHEVGTLHLAGRGARVRGCSRSPQVPRLSPAWPASCGGLGRHFSWTFKSPPFLLQMSPVQAAGGMTSHRLSWGAG